jgi:hypothetical protein
MTINIAREMVAAEMLKLRRNRPLMALAGLLTVGVVILLYVYTAIQHEASPGLNPAAGGLLNSSRAVRLLGLYFGALAAVLIGSEAGTADLSSGVFRDLVATGRSRLALFGVRAPAAAMLSLGFAAAAFALTLAGTFLFSAGGTPEPGLSVILESAAWIALSVIVTSGLAAGVGSLTGSRALTLTMVIGLLTVMTQILENITSLGSFRDVLPAVSLTQLMPIHGGIHLPVATGVAVTVVAAWLLIPTLAGAWRTHTMDA